MTREQEESIKKLVNIGLTYSVDYIYLLQDIKSILDGKQINPDKINKDDYLDF